MAVSCPEVMYGAYYPYLYGRAGPSRSFYQYERVSFFQLKFSIETIIDKMFTTKFEYNFGIITQFQKKVQLQIRAPHNFLVK